MVLSTAAGSSNVVHKSARIWRAGLLSPPSALLCSASPKLAWNLDFSSPMHLNARRCGYSKAVIATKIALRSVS